MWSVGSSRGIRGLGGNGARFLADDDGAGGAGALVGASEAEGAPGAAVALWEGGGAGSGDAVDGAAAGSADAEAGEAAGSGGDVGSPPGAGARRTA